MKSLSRRTVRVAPGLLLSASLCSLLSACSTLVGADFDHLSPANAGSGGEVASNGGRGSGVGGAGEAASAGNVGNGAGGGTSAGGAVSGGGSQSGGGSNGGGPSGGSSSGGSPSGGGPSGGGPSGGSSSNGHAGSAGASGGASGGGGAGGAGHYVSPTGLVLNELKGQGPGDDYVELFNPTGSALDISGCYISDDSNNRVTFPSGATIAASSYVLVRLQQAASTGMVTSCFGYSPCYDGITWGISANGEVITLADAKGLVLDRQTYPDQRVAVTGLKDGQALGRFPDGSTTVVAVLVSPGAPNEAAPAN